MIGARRCLACAAVVALSSCGDRSSPPPSATHGSLGGGIVARVGEVTISAELVAQVAAAQRVEPREALDRLVGDAVASEAARARHLDDTPAARWAIRSALARTTVTRIREGARNAGPLTDAELEGLSKQHWREVDCPEQIRVIHAVALRQPPDKKTADGDRKGKEVAANLLAAALQAKDDAEFEAKTKAVPHDGVQVQVERLPFFVPDDRLAEGPEGAMVPSFVAAAFKLDPGQTSDLVESEFGWHVIRAIERKPAVVVPVDARRTMFADEALAMRARRELEARLASQRKVAPVELAPGADELMTWAVLRRDE